MEKDALQIFETNLRLSKVIKFARRFSEHMYDIALSVKYHSPKAFRFFS